METKLFIVEDELAIQEVLQQYAQELGYQVANMSNSLETALDAIEHTDANFALLDIRLGDEKDGILVAEHLRKKHPIPYIFSTSLSDSETILRASLESPDGYLLNPFTKENMYATIELIKNKQRYAHTKNANRPTSMYVKADYALQKINFCDILYVNAEGNYVKINFHNGKNMMARATIKEFINELPSDLFFQIHKSYIVNLEHITSITSASVMIANAEIPLSMNCKAAFFSKLNLDDNVR